jgi:hypothetical protein
MDPAEETAGRGYNPTLPSGRRKKKPKKKAPKKPAPKKPAPKPAPKKNSTGGDQPVRVGRAAKQVPAKPKMQEQYIISKERGMYPVKPKKKKDNRSFGQRVSDAGQTAKKGKVYPRGFGQR